MSAYRERLAVYRGQRRRFYSQVKQANGAARSLLVNVTDAETMEQVADHIWVRWDDSASVCRHVGRWIEFEAVVRPYLYFYEGIMRGNMGLFLVRRVRSAE